MLRSNFFYFIMFAGLFYGFIYILDSNKAEAKFDNRTNLTDEALIHDWKVAKVKSHLQSDSLAKKYDGLRYQFLSSGGYVEYHNEMIIRTGSYSIRGEQLTINYDSDSSKDKLWAVEMQQDEEMTIKNDDLTILLLKVTK